MMIRRVLSHQMWNDSMCFMNEYSILTYILGDILRRRKLDEVKRNKKEARASIKKILVSFYFHQRCIKALKFIEKNEKHFCFISKATWGVGRESKQLRWKLSKGTKIKKLWGQGHVQRFSLYIKLVLLLLLTSLSFFFLLLYYGFFLCFPLCCENVSCCENALCSVLRIKYFVITLRKGRKEKRVEIQSFWLSIDAMWKWNYPFSNLLLTLKSFQYQTCS